MSRIISWLQDSTTIRLPWGFIPSLFKVPQIIVHSPLLIKNNAEILTKLIVPCCSISPKLIIPLFGPVPSILIIAPSSTINFPPLWIVKIPVIDKILPDSMVIVWPFVTVTSVSAKACWADGKNIELTSTSKTRENLGNAEFM